MPVAEFVFSVAVKSYVKIRILKLLSVKFIYPHIENANRNLVPTAYNMSSLN